MLTENTQRLLRIEAKLDAIFDRLEASFDPDRAIEALAKRGDKIGAIKLHRACYGSSLVDAKEQVEAMG